MDSATHKSILRKTRSMSIKDLKSTKKVSFKDTLKKPRSQRISRDALLVSSVTYQIHQFDPDTDACNVPYAEITEESLSEPTITTLQNSNFAYINKLNEKYIKCIMQRERLEYLATSSGQPITYDNNTPKNLFIFTLLGIIADPRCTVYIFLQVRQKTCMARLMAFGSTKIKLKSSESTFSSSNDLSRINRKQILEVFNLTRETQKYKRFVSRYGITKIHLFNSYETVEV